MTNTQAPLFDTTSWLGEHSDFNPEAEPFHPDPTFDQAMLFAAGFDDTLNSFGQVPEVKEAMDFKDTKEIKDIIR